MAFRVIKVQIVAYRLIESTHYPFFLSLLADLRLKTFPLTKEPRLLM